MDMKIIISNYLQSVVSAILLKQFKPNETYEKNNFNFNYIRFAIANC